METKKKRQKKKKKGVWGLLGDRFDLPVCDENKEQQQQPAGLTRMPNGLKFR